MHRACVSKGQSARSLANQEQDLGPSQVLFQRISPSLMLKVKCQDLIVRCSSAVLEIGVRIMTPDQERALDVLLRNFEAQINDLEAQVVSGKSSRVCQRLAGRQSDHVLQTMINFISLFAVLTFRHSTSTGARWFSLPATCCALSTHLLPL